MQTAISTRGVTVHADNVSLEGILTIPESASATVLVVAESDGSSRFSPRNQLVARHLNEAPFATLLFDLLTSSEELVYEKTQKLRLDIHLLARRLTDAIDWLQCNGQTEKLPIGLFAMGTSAAAAMIAAAQRPESVAAVVSLRGRPDLASDFLSRLLTPTLFTFEPNISALPENSREAKDGIPSERALKLGQGGGWHRFSKSGTLDDDLRLACYWFQRNLGC